MANHIQTAFSSDFLTFFRHDAHVFRHDFKRVFQHFFSQRHFKVQARADGIFDGEHVRVFDVAAVFAQVGGDALGTRRLGGMGGAQPLAASLAGACSLVVECRQSRIDFRLRTRYVDEQDTDLDDALAREVREFFRPLRVASR